MPELPEVEFARALTAEHGLGREIVAVDDADSYVCRPHAPGEIAAALTGRRLTHARPRGQFLWAETDRGAARDRRGPGRRGPRRARVRRRRTAGAARQATAWPRRDRAGLRPRRARR